MHQIRRATFTIGAIVAFTFSVSCDADQVLVFGGATGSSQLSADLVSLGHSVTHVASSTVPSNLSQYDTIWHVGITAFSAIDKSRLEAFIETGGGLHLTGEVDGCCAPA